MIGNAIYERLRRRYSVRLEEFVAPRLRGVSLYEFIVAVMLSQNTSDENAWRAYVNLKKELGSVTPESVLKLSEGELAELIKPAGMQNQRAARIRELARAFLSTDVDAALKSLLSSGKLEEARSMLMEMPGVGPKTADVALLMYYGAPTFPVDTHIARITRRLGYVEKGNYEAVRKFWMENTSPELYLPLHLLLIAHGRETCKAGKPLCGNCVIRSFCAHGGGRAS